MCFMDCYFMKSQAHGVDINSKTFVKVDEVEITRYSNQWHLISVPFVIPIHPLEDEKPKSPEEVINHDYIDDITVRISICFTNEYLRKFMNGKKGDPKFFQYYHSEVKYLTMEVNRNEKKANFLFPKMIADKNEYGSQFQVLLDMWSKCRLITKTSNWKTISSLSVTEMMKSLKSLKMKYFLRDLRMKIFSFLPTWLIPASQKMWDQ